MLSYTFRNKKLKRKDILEVCNKEFKLKTLKNSNRVILLTSDLLTISIEKKYTRIILKNENVNIEKIEDFFFQK